MLFARILLLIHGLTTLIFGVALLIEPAGVAEFIGLAIVTEDGKAELVAMYTGMSGAMALFMLYAVFRSKWLKEALLFMMLSMTGITIGRLFSTAVFDVSSYTLNALFYDIPVTSLSWVAYYRLEKIAAQRRRIEPGMGSDQKD